MHILHTSGLKFFSICFYYFERGWGDELVCALNLYSGLTGCCEQHDRVLGTKHGCWGKISVTHQASVSPSGEDRRTRLLLGLERGVFLITGELGWARRGVRGCLDVSEDGSFSNWASSLCKTC